MSFWMIDRANNAPIESPYAYEMGSRSLSWVAAGIHPTFRVITEWDPSCCVNGVDPFVGDRLELEVAS